MNFLGTFFRCGVGFLASALLAFGQGALTPPPTVAPTYRTLEEIASLRGTPIPALGQSQPFDAGNGAYLTENIFFDASVGPGVIIRGGTLDLNGFAIIGFNSPVYPAVSSGGTTTIRNGFIAGEWSAAVASGGAKVILEDCIVSGVGPAVLDTSDDLDVEVKRCQLELLGNDNPAAGFIIQTQFGTVLVEDSQITDGRISAFDTRVKRSLIDAGGFPTGTGPFFSGMASLEWSSMGGGEVPSQFSSSITPANLEVVGDFSELTAKDSVFSFFDTPLISGRADVDFERVVVRATEGISIPGSTSATDLWSARFKDVVFERGNASFTASTQIHDSVFFLQNIEIDGPADIDQSLFIGDEGVDVKGTLLKVGDDSSVTDSHFVYADEIAIAAGENAVIRGNSFSGQEARSSDTWLVETEGGDGTEISENFFTGGGNSRNIFQGFFSADEGGRYLGNRFTFILSDPFAVQVNSFPGLLTVAPEFSDPADAENTSHNYAYDK